MIRLLILLTLSLIAGGCTTVYPMASPARPMRVYIADYGIHSSLLLPTDDGRYVEYAYGDWNFAALNHTWPNDAVGALLFSAQATLGRRYIDLSAPDAEPQPTHPRPRHMEVLYAPQRAVAQLVRELDERYRRDGSGIYNPTNGMTYVKDGEHYFLTNNCNHLTARCLRELGCDVRGWSLLSNFAIAPTQLGVSPQPLLATARPATLPTAQAN